MAKGALMDYPVRMLTLPADTPELNPMENVWEYLRPNKLCAMV